MAHTSGDSFLQDVGANADVDVLELAHQFSESHQLVVAVNRGPLSFSEDQSVGLTARRDSNRASELFERLEQVPIAWVSGAAGAGDRRAADELGSADHEIHSEELPDAWSLRFVSPPRRVHHKFYNVICNPLLWFLLHRSWSPTFTPVIGAQEHDAWNRGYRTVNELFANQAIEAAGDRRLALVGREFHLMLLPGLVRARTPDAVIHHSFETPWPWPSDLAMLPAEWREEILGSLLSADVLSFGTQRDINAFVACVNEFVDADILEFEKDGVTIGDRSVRLTVSASAIRSERFLSVTDFDHTQRFISDLADENYVHTFVTVDRSEPHKNIVRSINAFGDLLKQRPQLRNEVRYLLFLSPGPSHISAYKRLSDEIRRAARRVNDAVKGAASVKVFEENNFYRSVAALSIYDTLVSVPVIDSLGRTALDGAMVNSAGSMILSESNGAADLFDDNVQRVGFANTKAICDAMIAAVDESDVYRLKNGTRLHEIVMANPSDNALRQILVELTFGQ